MVALHQDGNALEHMFFCSERDGSIAVRWACVSFYNSGEMKNDTTIVMAALQQDGRAVEHAGQEMNHYPLVERLKPHASDPIKT